MKNYIDELDNLRIHELRDLARKMGVQSPTTLKKEQIISSIMDILSGNKEPYVSTSKQGRPARNQEKTLSIEDVFEEKPEYKPYDLTRPFSTSFTLAQPGPKYEVVNEDECDDVFGYLDVKENYAVLHTNGMMPSDEDVLVSIDDVKKLNLKSGFKVGGKKPRNGAKNGFVTNLQTDEKTYFDINKSEGRALKTKLNLKNNKNNIYLGGKYYFEKESNQELYDFVNKLADDIYKNNACKVRILWIDALKEMIDAKNVGIDMYALPFNRTPEQITCVTNLYIEQSKREVERAHNVVLIICGYANLLKYYHALHYKNTINSNIDYNAVLDMKNIISSAINVDKDSSLTIITCQLNTMQPAIKECVDYELKPLFNEVN